MSKNMTRKGLALGTAFAIAITGFTAMPASANGISNGSVSLSPNAGDEYDILAGSQFDLKANFATAVQGTGKYLKFRVDDATGSTHVVTAAGTSVYSVALADATSNLLVSNGAGSAADVATLTLAASHRFKAGDRVRISGTDAAFISGAAAGGYNFNGVFTISGTPSSTSITIDFDGASGDGVTATTKRVATVAMEPSRPTPYSITSADGADSVISSNVLTITTSAAHQLQKGDTVRLASFNSTIDGDRVVASVPSGTTFTIALTADDLSATDLDGTITRIRAGYTSYIYDTKRDSNAGADSVLRIASTDNDVTQTITVSAWVDDNNNDLIDATEYVSAVRTVRFLAHSAVVPVVTLDPIYVGQSTVTATVSTPGLNGAQLAAANNRNGVSNALRLAFTRPGSDKALWTSAANMTYSNVTKLWSAISPNMNATSGETSPDGVSTQWGISQATTPINLATGDPTATITKNVITIADLPTAHGLQVGDRIVLTGTQSGSAVSEPRLLSATSGTAQYSVVTSVPTTTSFTYTETTAAGAAATGADVAKFVITAGSVAITRMVRNFTTTGEYTATAYLYKGSTTAAMTTTGVIARQVVGASVSDSATIEGVASANVNIDGQVRKGTTSAAFVVTVNDEDGARVAAGVKVAVKAAKTLGTSGTVKVNGTTVGTTQVTIPAVTNADGQVALTIENSSAAAGDQVNLEVDSEGATATKSAVWADAVYSIVDLNDASTPGSPARNRAAAADGKYTFDLAVLDQFKQPAGTGVRLLATITGRTTMTTPVALTAGRASVTVTPDGSAVTGTTSVDMKFQTQSTAGVWSNVEGTVSDSLYTDWASGEAGVVTINFYNQTDRVALNANGANLPSLVTAVRTANVTTKALKAIDLRTVNGAAESYPTTAKAVVSGAVTNVTTGVAKAGGVVTISGTGLLFKVGDVWALNTLTFIANDGTFAVDVYSRVSGQQTVTVASGSVTSTAVLTFNAVGGATATGLTVNLVTPATAGPGTTFQVQGQVRDANGNPIVISTAGTGANPTLTVTYNGPGLVSGALPTTTNATGTFSFFVLLGSNDRGTATVTATYDADGTGTAAAAISKTNTITVGAGPVGTGKVNVGSFNGKLVVYASGLNGKRISWKVGGNWGSAVASSNYAIFNRPTPRAGVTVSVDIYVDGVKTLTKSVVTR
jgi:hypothetical protein